MPGTGASDVLYDVGNLISDSRTGFDEPLFVLSLDQFKCYDRLHFPTLKAIQQHLWHPVLDHILADSDMFNRLLLLDEQPSAQWLHGEAFAGFLKVVLPLTFAVT